MQTPTPTPTPTPSGGAIVSSGFHLLQIYGYSLSKYTPNGTSIKSCPFTVGGYRWVLNFFPNGDRPESADFISLFLTLDQDDVYLPVKMQLEFSFIGEVERQDPAHVRTRPMIALPNGGFSVGYPGFVEREAFEKSSHLRDDRVTIRCDVVVIEHVNDVENGGRPIVKCVACNIRAAVAAIVPVSHVCLCDPCYNVSFSSLASTQCAGCHDTLAGTALAFRPGPIPPFLQPPEPADGTMP